ncbi:hypothetical protein A8708_07150 [Paenibacillus oryzisoli]|uniref:Uncharacterized protein n=1 Tax=Paenibacillus oryzisoli TaxID=1850517 RepID=A0A198ALK3_9BACL|nr:hypothetical protein A8708_07150 [Paenibacillus oryzisoli]
MKSETRLSSQGAGFQFVEGSRCCGHLKKQHSIVNFFIRMAEQSSYDNDIHCLQAHTDVVERMH